MANNLPVPYFKILKHLRDNYFSNGLDIKDDIIDNDEFLKNLSIKFGRDRILRSVQSVKSKLHKGEDPFVIGKITSDVSKRIKKYLESGVDIDDSVIRNDDVLSKGFEILGKERFSKILDRNKVKLNVKFKNLESKILNGGNSMGEKNISPDLIKKAMEECLAGQCDLLKSIKDEIKGLKESISNKSVSEDDSKKVMEQLNSLQDTFKKFLEGLPGKMAEETASKVGGEIESLAQQMLKALLELKNEFQGQRQVDTTQGTQVQAQGEARGEVQGESLGDSQEVKSSAKSKPSKARGDRPSVVPLERALRDDAMRKQVIDVLLREAQKDPSIANDLISLAEKCRMGDKESCKAIENRVEEAAKDSKIEAGQHDISRIEERISNLEQILKDIAQKMHGSGSEDTVKSEIKEGVDVSKSVQTTNPLRDRLFAN